jgi:ABC-type multidrug transport system permease subunit
LARDVPRLSWWQEFSILTRRSVTAASRDPVLVKARFGQTIVIALIASLMYLRLDKDQASVQNIAGALFFLLINQSFTGAFGVLQTFPDERVIFQREYEAGSYGIVSYYISRILADLPGQLLFPTLFVAITYWSIGFGDDADKFGAFLGIILLASNSAFSLGYFISALVPNVGVALAVGPVVLLPFLLTGGLFQRDSSIPDYFIWLEEISFFKYGFSALQQIVWRDVELDTSDCRPPSAAAGAAAAGPPCFYTGDDVLAFYDVSTDDMTTDVVALVVMVIAYRVLAFAALWWRSRTKQNE